METSVSDATFIPGQLYIATVSNILVRTVSEPKLFLDGVEMEWLDEATPLLFIGVERLQDSEGTTLFHFLGPTKQIWWKDRGNIHEFLKELNAPWLGFT